METAFSFLLHQQPCSHGDFNGVLSLLNPLAGVGCILFLFHGSTEFKPCIPSGLVILFLHHSVVNLCMFDHHLELGDISNAHSCWLRLYDFLVRDFY